MEQQQNQIHQNDGQESFFNFDVGKGNCQLALFAGQFGVMYDCGGVIQQKKISKNFFKYFNKKDQEWPYLYKSGTQFSQEWNSLKIHQEQLTQTIQASNCEKIFSSKNYKIGVYDKSIDKKHKQNGKQNKLQQILTAIIKSSIKHIFIIISHCKVDHTNYLGALLWKLKDKLISYTIIWEGPIFQNLKEGQQYSEFNCILKQALQFCYHNSKNSQIQFPYYRYGLSNGERRQSYLKIIEDINKYYYYHSPSQQQKNKIKFQYDKKQNPEQYCFQCYQQQENLTEQEEQKFKYKNNQTLYQFCQSRKLKYFSKLKKFQKNLNKVNIIHSSFYNSLSDHFLETERQKKKRQKEKDQKIKQEKLQLQLKKKQSQPPSPSLRTRRSKEKCMKIREQKLQKIKAKKMKKQQKNSEEVMKKKMKRFKKKYHQNDNQMANQFSAIVQVNFQKQKTRYIMTGNINFRTINYLSEKKEQGNIRKFNSLQIQHLNDEFLRCLIIPSHGGKLKQKNHLDQIITKNLYLLFHPDFCSISSQEPYSYRPYYKSIQLFKQNFKKNNSKQYSKFFQHFIKCRNPYYVKGYKQLQNKESRYIRNDQTYKKLKQQKTLVETYERLKNQKKFIDKNGQQKDLSYEQQKLNDQNEEDQRKVIVQYKQFLTKITFQDLQKIERQITQQFVQIDRKEKFLQLKIFYQSIALSSIQQQVIPFFLTSTMGTLKITEKGIQTKRLNQFIIKKQLFQISNHNQQKLSKEQTQNLTLVLNYEKFLQENKNCSITIPFKRRTNQIEIEIFKNNKNQDYFMKFQDKQTQNYYYKMNKVKSQTEQTQRLKKKLRKFIEDQKMKTTLKSNNQKVHNDIKPQNQKNQAQNFKRQGQKFSTNDQLQFKSFPSKKRNTNQEKHEQSKRQKKNEQE